MAMKIFKNKKEVKTEKALAPKMAAQSGEHFVIKSVIKRPHASEKAYGLHAQNQYVFIVDNSANKTLVKEEVQRRYNVKVVAMNIVVNKGKVKMFRGRRGTASISKKAYVTLKEGDKIEIA